MTSLEQKTVNSDPALNVLTIDVEDWYQGISRYTKVFSPLPRLQCSLRGTLDLLEKHKATATFFVLGEVALNFPDLVEEIVEKGHEVGCHGFSHRHIFDLGRNAFDKELGKATRLLEKICQQKILSFRAPLFSLTKITSWALSIMRKHGYMFDSSIFPTYHPFYGVPKAPNHPYRPSFANIEREDEEGKIMEFPILIKKVLGINVPVGGGTYLRFLGKFPVASAIRSLNKRGWPATIYMHPWEIDDFVPSVKFDPLVKFVTFYRVGKIKKTLEWLLKSFRFVSIRDFTEKAIF